MKKLLLLIALFTLMGGVNSVKAEKVYADLSKLATVDKTNATWDGETNTITWIGQTNNMVTNFDFAAGDYSSYESILVSVSELSNAIGVRIQIRANGKEIAKPVNGTGTIGVSLSSFGFGENDLKSVEWIRLLGSGYYDGESHTINSDNPASAKIDYVCLLTPASLNFDDSGNATINFTDLIATGGLSFNEETGELTNDGTGGTLYVNLPTDGLDFTNMTSMTVNRSGDDLIDRLVITDTKNSITNGFWGSKYGVNFTSGDGTKFNSATNVNSIVWHGNSTVGTMTISSIVFKANVITTNPREEIAIETLERKYLDGGEWKTGTVTYSYGSGIGTPVGDGNSTQDEYIDLSNYSEIRLYASSGDVRIFVVKDYGFKTNEDGYIITKDGIKKNGQWGGIQDSGHKLVKNGDYYYIAVNDLKTACGGQAKLIGVKAEYGQTVDISKVVVVEKCYNITGSGDFASSVSKSLADSYATYYDATGVTGTGVELNAANKNALFKANEGVLANTDNVIVDDDCASLVLTDGNYSFEAPNTFTATSASYNRTFTVDQPSTVCLPFALTEAEVTAAGTFYALTDYSAETLTFTEVATTNAYKPYLFIAKEAEPFSNYSNKPIGATPTDPADLSVIVGDAIMTGTMARQSVNGKYGWNSANGEFSKATADAVTIDPFRAYVTVSGGSSPARMATRFINGSITGINEVVNTEAKNILNPDRKYFVNGKFVIEKNGVKYNAAGAQIK